MLVGVSTNLRMGRMVSLRSKTAIIMTNMKASANHLHRSLSTCVYAAFATFAPVHTSSVSLSIVSPMTDIRHRRTKYVKPPVSDRPSHLPVRTRRPIKVLSQAALDDARKKESLSVFAGWRGALLGIVTHLLVGSVFLTVVEGWAIIDAIYFSIVVATTVGYGDIAPKNPISKIFVGVYAIVSVAIIANLLQSLVARLTDAQRDLTSAARATILGTSHASSQNVSQIVETDLLVITRLAAVKTRLRLYTTVSMLVGACLVGIVVYKLLLNVSIVDAVYFLFISMTTVGLGDIHPLTSIGKLFSVVWLVLISLSFANILSQYADMRMKEREYDTASSILSREMSDRMFEEIDDNNDGTLSEAEYLGYILCKLKKASPEDVRSILLRFRELDLDESGFITKKEIEAVSKKEK